MFTSLSLLLTLASVAQDRVIHAGGCLPGYDNLSAEMSTSNNQTFVTQSGSTITTEGSPGNSVDIRIMRFRRARDLILAGYNNSSDDDIKADLRKINRKLRAAGVTEISADDLRKELRIANERKVFCAPGTNHYMFRKEMRGTLASLIISKSHESPTVAVIPETVEDDSKFD